MATDFSDEVAEIKGIRKPTRDDIQKVLKKIIKVKKEDKKAELMSYLNEVSDNPQKILDDIESYKDYHKDK